MKKIIPDKVSRGEVSVPDRLRALDETQRHAVLATISGEQPFTSLISYVLAPDSKSIVFATPRETSKYDNLLKNRKVALLIDTRANRDEDYLEAEAITIIGDARSVESSEERSQLSKLFIQKHPELAGFVNSPATALVSVKIARCFHVGRFQTVSEWPTR